MQLILIYFCLFEIFTITYQNYTRDLLLLLLFFRVLYFSSFLFRVFIRFRFIRLKICFQIDDGLLFFIFDKLNLWFRLVKDVLLFCILIKSLITRLLFDCSQFLLWHVSNFFKLLKIDQLTKKQTLQQNFQMIISDFNTTEQSRIAFIYHAKRMMTEIFSTMSKINH